MKLSNLLFAVLFTCVSSISLFAGEPWFRSGYEGYYTIRYYEVGGDTVDKYASDGAHAKVTFSQEDNSLELRLFCEGVFESPQELKFEDFWNSQIQIGRGSQTRLGLSKVSGKTWTICVGPSNGFRPLEYVTTRGNQNLLIVLEEMTTAQRDTTKDVVAAKLDAAAQAAKPDAG